MLASCCPGAARSRLARLIAWPWQGLITKLGMITLVGTLCPGTSRAPRGRDVTVTKSVVTGVVSQSPGDGEERCANQFKLKSDTNMRQIRDDIS